MSLPARPSLSIYEPVLAALPAAIFRRLRTAILELRAVWQRPLIVAANPQWRAEAWLSGAAVTGILCVMLLGDADFARLFRQSPHWLVAIFQWITMLGLSGYIFAIAAVVLVASLLLRDEGLGRRADLALNLLAGRAFFVIAVNAVSGIGSQVVKHVFGRARPRLMEQVGALHFDLFSVKAAYASFPSGHTVTVIATALTLSWFAPRLRWPLFILAGLVGVSRLVISAHYPADVLAGALLGGVTTILMRRAFAARRFVFRQAAAGVRTRGAGLVMAPLRAVLERRIRGGD